MELVKGMMPIRDLFLRDNENGVPHWQEKGKYILQLQLGFDTGTPRKPLGELTPEYKKKIEQAMAESVGNSAQPRGCCAAFTLHSNLFYNHKGGPRNNVGF